MDIPKNGKKIIYVQMPAPRELPQQIPTPRAKANMEKCGWGQIFDANSRGVCGGGGMVMDEIDTCIIASRQWTIRIITHRKSG